MHDNCIPRRKTGLYLYLKPTVPPERDRLQAYLIGLDDEDRRLIAMPEKATGSMRTTSPSSMMRFSMS